VWISSIISFLVKASIIKKRYPICLWVAKNIKRAAKPFNWANFSAEKWNNKWNRKDLWKNGLFGAKNGAGMSIEYVYGRIIKDLVVYGTIVVV